jgi:hypothetical protein
VFFDCLCFGDIVCAELVEGTCAPRKTAALKNKAIVTANLRDDFNIDSDKTATQGGSLLRSTLRSAFLNFGAIHRESARLTIVIEETAAQQALPKM